MLRAVIDVEVSRIYANKLTSGHKRVQRRKIPENYALNSRVAKVAFLDPDLMDREFGMREGQEFLLRRDRGQRTRRDVPWYREGIPVRGRDSDVSKDDLLSVPQDTQC